MSILLRLGKKNWSTEEAIDYGVISSYLGEERMKTVSPIAETHPAWKAYLEYRAKHGKVNPLPTLVNVPSSTTKAKVAKSDKEKKDVPPVKKATSATESREKPQKEEDAKKTSEETVSSAKTGQTNCRFAADHSKCKWGKECRFLLNEKGERPVENIPVDVAELIQKFPVICATPHVEKYLTGIGQPCVVVPSSNTHPLSHACRDAALLTVLLSEGKGKKELNVLDWFGSDRNQKLISALCKKQSDIKINLVSAPADPYQGDATRSAKSRRALNPLEKFDVVVVQDVYSYGADGSQPMDSAAVKKLLALTHTNKVYFIVRFFNGDAGWDETPDFTEPEMIWYRELGMIYASSDKFTTFYPAHPDVNWMQKRHHEGLDCSVITVRGPYSVVQISLAPADAKAVGAQVIPVGQIQKLQVSCNRIMPRSFIDRWNSSILSYVYTWTPVVDCLVHLPTLTSANFTYNSRMPYGQAIDSATRAVREEFTKEPSLKYLFKRAPHIEMALVSGTALAMLYHKRDETAQQLKTLRTDYAEAEVELGEARAVKTPVNNTRLYVRLGVAALAFAATAGAIYVRYKGIQITTGSSQPTFAPHEVLSPSYICGVAPFWEEVATSAMPKASVALWIYEYATVTMVTRNPVAGLPALFLHLNNVRRANATTAPLTTFAQNFVMHSTFNFVVLWTSPIYETHRRKTLEWFSSQKTVYQDFKKQYIDQVKIEQPSSDWVPLPAKETIDAVSSNISEMSVKIGRGIMECFVHNNKVSVGTFVDLAATQDYAKGKIYPILITQALMYKPAKSAANMIVALASRLHNDPHVDCPPAKERHETWIEQTEDMIEQGLFPGEIEKLESVEDCAKIMGPKGKRIVDADNRDTLGNNHVLSKKINLKTDETIVGHKLVFGSFSIKPRTIVDLEALFHSRTTQEARALAAHLHTIWNEGEIYSYHGYPVRIVFCSGYTGGHLTSLAKYLLDPTCTTILVGGDDSLIRHGKLFIEGDYSAFDHSQDEGPLVHSFTRWAKAMGASKGFCSLLIQSERQSYTARVGEFVIRGSTPIQLCTGETMTTVKNSVSNAASHLYSLRNGMKDPVAFAKKLGFTLKMRTHHNLSDATFLKGWWLPDGNGGFAWICLPSLVVKLGKVMTDPATITKTFKTKDGKNLSREDAIRVTAYGIQLSYGAIPDDYPIMGAFMSTLRRLGLWHERLNEVQIQVESHSYKSMPSVVKLDRQAAVEAVCYRYDLLPEDVFRVEALLNSVDSLPAYVEDPVFSRLVEVDYA